MLEKVYYTKRDPKTGLRLVFPKEIKSEPYKKGLSIVDDITASAMLKKIKPVFV